MKLKGFVHYATQVYVTQGGHVRIDQNIDDEEHYVLLSSAQAFVIADKLAHLASEARQIQGGIEDVEGEQ
jgi:hypothetical protein